MTNPKAAIFDLDGTLVDDAHLLHLAHEKVPDYDLFHAEAEKCKPNRKVLEDLLQAYWSCRILIVTARSEAYRGRTEDWLNRHGVPYDALMMRTAGDDRADVEIKSDLLVGAQYYYDILFAYEDNPDVAKMWESRGIPTTLIVPEAIDG